MIGRGIFKLLTDDLSRPDIPSVGQQWFNAVLFQQCGCRIAWHRTRRVFVVYRPRGVHARPQTYMDLGREHFPLSSPILVHVVTTVRYTDARLNRDPMKMHEAMESLRKSEEMRARDKYVDERWPDFMADMIRAREIASDGRRRKTRNVLVA